MGPKEILVVDDELDEVTILTFLLVAEGYRVHHALNGLRALQVLSQSAVDLVLTDYMMPQMDGCDLLRKIRASKKTATMPVLMISELPEVVVRMRCGPVGAFLHKPFPPKLLLSLVRDLLVAEA